MTAMAQIERGANRIYGVERDRPFVWKYLVALGLALTAGVFFGATYGPLAGTIGILLWSFLSSVALFAGLAGAAQLEAVRAGCPEPQRDS